jgi:TBC domain-containing protein kinase-like protein
MQLKEENLMLFGFNECILLFSDMPDIDIQKCIQDTNRVFRTTPLSVTMRRHDKASVELATQGQGVGELGKIRLPIDEFKERDVSIPGHADVEMITLKQLKEEACPRISVSDLVFLCGLEEEVLTVDSNTGMRSKSPSPNPKPTPERKKPKSKATVVDIRSQQEFNRGHVPRSLNLPQGQSIMPDGTITLTGDGPQVMKLKGKPIIIIGNKHNNTAQVCLDCSKKIFTVKVFFQYTTG